MLTKKEVSTRNIKTYRNFGKTELSNSLSLMKTQPQIGNHFPELVARLEYLNPIKKFLFTQLKIYTFSGEDSHFCDKTVKTEKRQSHFPDSKTSKNIISGKTIPKTTFGQNKNVSGGTEARRNRSSIIVEEGTYSTGSEFKASISQQHFSETEKRRLFPSNYEFRKFKLVNSTIHISK